MGNSGAMAESSITNILIIKPGAIGDLLQMTPVIRLCTKSCLRPEFPSWLGTLHP